MSKINTGNLLYGIVSGTAATPVAYAAFGDLSGVRAFLNAFDYSGLGLYSVVRLDDGEVIPYVHNGSGWVLDTRVSKPENTHGLATGAAHRRF